MKEFDMLSASSQVSTALHFRNMEEGSSSSSSSSSIQIPGSSPAIDRYNPIILDPRRLGNPSSSPFLRPTPPPPPPNRQNHNTGGNNTTTDSFASKINNKLNKKKQKQQKPTTIKDDDKRKSSTDANNTCGDKNISSSSNIMSGRRSWSSMNMNMNMNMNMKKADDRFNSPPGGSSRYLLSEKAFLNAFSDFEPVLNLAPPEPSKTTHVAIRKNESATAISMHSTSAPPATDQVVALRVSLHCRGCERKMRKHLSRMEGVTSFNIDFAAKKVTVVGKVTPLEVLANILKVKNAQLWTPPISQTNFEMKKP